MYDPCALEEFVGILETVLERVVGEGRSRGKAKVETGRHMRELLSQGLLEPACYAVAVYGSLAHVSADGHRNARWETVAAIYETEREARTPEHDPRALNAVEIAGCTKSVGFWKHSRF